MKSILIAAAALAALSVCPATALAQDVPYRSSVPDVMPAPQQPTTDTSGIIGRFRKAYNTHGRPRLVVFWNRKFSAQTATNYDHYSKSTTKTHESGGAHTEAYGEGHAYSWYGTHYYGHSGADSSYGHSGVTENETHSGVKSTGTDDATAPDSDSTSDWEFEGAFTDVLSSVPVRLIDRATIMRTSARGLSAGETSNVQAIEAAAIMAKADYIVELLANADGNSLSGYTFKITIRSVKSGTIVASFTTKGVPVEASQVHYVAGSDGFTEAKATVTDEAVGRELALETMDKLARRWRK